MYVFVEQDYCDHFLSIYIYFVIRYFWWFLLFYVVVFLFLPHVLFVGTLLFLSTFYMYIISNNYYCELIARLLMLK